MKKLKKENFNTYISAFLEENSKINLISKNEEKFLWEKHIFDSLSISLFFEKYLKDLSGKRLLDIGTGGGFPAVPAAINYPEIQVFALDSIKKKLIAIENIKAKLNLKNLTTINERAENLHDKFDIITVRAVGKLDKIAKYALPLLKKNGYFIAYKSKTAEEEIKEAQKNISKLGGKIIDVISYQLPTEEIYERNLVIIKKA
ncbi:16S rRNA (guanine(527)-N(7))-methyltransferase RsmG [bacterium]|nr:16S rRNA (guanine(527)-N(7))-methyltransferase RsmG [bacterium]